MLTSFFQALKKDLFAFGWLVVVSLCLGMTINQFRPEPPPQFQSPDSALVRTVYFSEFRRAVEDKSALILDARPGDAWRQGHIPEASNLSPQDLKNNDVHFRLPEADKNKQIMVYCSGAGCKDSLTVANGLIQLGYQNVWVFRGGWTEWIKRGMTRVKEQ